MKTAKRLEHIEEYYFSKKLKEVGYLISKGKPIINLGIGSPDLMPPKSSIDSMIKALQSSVANKYQAYKGIEPLRKAIKDFYLKNYNVSLNHKEEILPLKTLAVSNIASRFVTFDTSQEFKSWLNCLAPLNIEDMLVTLDTSHPPIFWLNCNAP